MECSEKPRWTEYKKEELTQITIPVLDEETRRQVKYNWDQVAKPLDGMGRFEEITAQIGAIQRTHKICVDKKAVIVMCADNGIVEEGISQSGWDVTRAVAESMGKGRSSVGKMAKVIGADVFPVDIGIMGDEPISGVIPRKVRCGTRNFACEPAMTEQEMIQAMAVGIEMAFDCKEKGYDILAVGEMGIGNTTTSSAVAAALLGSPVPQVTGKGAGLDHKGLKKKQKVIETALARYDLYQAQPLVVLQTVGGLDMAGMMGVCVGAALCHMPVVLDGVISLAAGLLAERVFPGTKDYLIPSHQGKEPAAEGLAEELEQNPVIYGEMALGEGTGAVMMLSLLDVAISVYQDKTSFEDISISRYERWDAERV